MKLRVFSSLFAAFVAVSAQVLPPSQNTATSASEDVNTAQYYNQNFYARDESRTRQHSTTFGNNAEGTRNVATAMSDPLPLPAIDPLNPHHPVQHPHIYRIAPYLFYGLTPDIANTFNNMPISSYFSPVYATLSDPLYPHRAFPDPAYYTLQNALPVSQTNGILEEPLLNPAIELPPVQLVDPTLLQPVYADPPTQSHYSATNNFNRLFAAANPYIASSQIVTDNSAYSKDVL